MGVFKEPGATKIKLPTENPTKKLSFKPEDKIKRFPRKQTLNSCELMNFPRH